MEHLNLKHQTDFEPNYEEIDYVIEGSFQNFPANNGWNLDASTGKLDRQLQPHIKRFEDLIRSWLFFGLILAVVYDSQTEDIGRSSGKFTERAFVKDTKISTHNLPIVLEEWRTWEVAQERKTEQRMRMIRAQLALNLARKVVVKYCSLENLDLKGKLKHVYSVDNNLALTLMVLGETLTNAKAQIIKQIGFDVRGWYGDPTVGWGTPLAVIKAMEDWCPRTVELLQAQLNNNATALLSAYESHMGHKFKGHKRVGCTKKECKVNSSHPSLSGRYATKHHPECLHWDEEEPCLPYVASEDGSATFGRSCRARGDPNIALSEKIHEAPTCYTPCDEMVNVDMNRVLEILDQGRIPLLKFNERKTSRDAIILEVTDNVQSSEYATISHVWSDGYGNDKDNKLYRCQLDYFWRLLRQAESYRTMQRKGYPSKEKTQPLAFWMDTLVIPVQEDAKHKAARKKAIHQIYSVFSKAKYTIVIDNGLNTMTWDYNSYTTTAMRILASGWMRRLWTLQEAYLSRKLLFAFKSRSTAGDGDLPLVDLDDIEELFDETGIGLVSNLHVTARSYYHNLLGPDRKARIHNLSSTNGAGLVASAWRAAQWRTTTHLEHETLALATLLNLDFSSKPFGSAELLKGLENKGEKCNEMMKDFWSLLEETSPGAIPPGIIFLPGERIRIQGFGWAPTSWMTAKAVDHPDPIAVMSKTAQLNPAKGGLLVEYPGFLLHCEERNAIVGSTHGDGFWFPSDNSLAEWYHVTNSADDISYSDQKGIVRAGGDLAIILCRPRPGQAAEIGLLVEIHKEREQRELGKDQRKRVFAVYMLRRIKICREAGEEKIKELKREMIETCNPDLQKRVICGEALDDDQKWYVDCRTTSLPDEEGVSESEPTSFVGTDMPPISRPLGLNGATERDQQSGSDRDTSRATTEHTHQESDISGHTTGISVPDRHPPQPSQTRPDTTDRSLSSESHEPTPGVPPRSSTFRHFVSRDDSSRWTPKWLRKSKTSTADN